MKKFIVFSLVCMLSTFLFVACERNEGVQAGREEDTGATAGRTEGYEPAPAPGTDPSMSQGQAGMSQDIQGQLVRINEADQTVVVRAENGMEQTFKYNDQTMLMGMNQQGQDQRSATEQKVSSLKGKEGSEVRISYREEGGQKIATMVNVTQMKSGTGQ